MASHKRARELEQRVNDLSKLTNNDDVKLLFVWVQTEKHWDRDTQRFLNEKGLPITQFKAIGQDISWMVARCSDLAELREMAKLNFVQLVVFPVL